MGRDGSEIVKESDHMNDLPIMNQENMQNNIKVINYSRTFMSIIGGVIAGILGLTGVMGFVFYFLIMGITSVGLAAKAGFSIRSYFDSWNKIILDGFLGGLMSFVLFWTQKPKGGFLNITLSKQSRVENFFSLTPKDLLMTLYTYSEKSYMEKETCSTDNQQMLSKYSPTKALPELTGICNVF